MSFGRVPHTTAATYYGCPLTAHRLKQIPSEIESKGKLNGESTKIESRTIVVRPILLHADDTRTHHVNMSEHIRPIRPHRGGIISNINFLCPNTDTERKRHIAEQKDDESFRRNGERVARSATPPMPAGICKLRCRSARVRHAIRSFDFLVKFLFRMRTRML